MQSDYGRDVARHAFQRLGNISTNAMAPAWRCVEKNAMRTVFRTDNATTNHGSIVSLEVLLYNDIKKLTFKLRVSNWKSPFGVGNRIVYPLKTKP